MSDDDLSCIDGPDGCSGPVEWRTTPDRRDGKAFTRCDAHFDKRMDEVERNLELMSDVPAPWFDPAYAGESWGEESPDPYWMND
jgi:hypothetical protein